MADEVSEYTSEKELLFCNKLHLVETGSPLKFTDRLASNFMRSILVWVSTKVMEIMIFSPAESQSRDYVRPNFCVVDVIVVVVVIIVNFLFKRYLL